MIHHKYPIWIEPDNAEALERAIDSAIANRVIYDTPDLSFADMDQIADNVMQAVYAAVDSQVEIQINKRAYSGS